MREAEIGDISSVYSCSERCRVYWRRIWHPEFFHFCDGLRRLERSLGDTGNDDYWRTFLWVLRRYRFLHLSSPLPFDHPAVCPNGAIEGLGMHLANCSQVYPAFADMSQEVLEAFAAIYALSCNPMLDDITEICAQTATSTAMLIREPKMMAPVASILASRSGLRTVEVVSVQELRKCRCYERMIVVGPARWQPDHVLSAPRASSLHVVHYSWIRDTWRPEPVFVSSPNEQDESTRETMQESTRVIVGVPTELREADYMDAEELTPATDWRTVSAAISQSRCDNTDPDNVQARLFLFEDRTAVLLEAEEGTTSLIIDLDEDPTSRVKRIPVLDISPGQFILLRTTGGGDHIVTVADRILGEHAGMARERQMLWKSRLREKIVAKGRLRVAIDLLDLGSGIANETNACNWASDRSIKTRDYADFLAIMRYVDLEDESSDYWDTMCNIDGAHRRAGSYIRNLLLRQVLSSDLRVLERQGRMDFELGQADGGSLTAFRVADVSPDTFTVPSTQLMHLFSLEEELWQR